MRLLNQAVVLKRALIAVEVERGEFAGAIALVDTFIAAHAFNADAFLDRADIQERAGDLELARADRLRALAQIERALLQRPSEMRRLSRARALLGLGRVAAAVAELEAIVARSPRFGDAQRMLVEARARPARAAKARSHGQGLPPKPHR